MRRLLALTALLALTGCQSMPLSAPGPLSTGQRAQSAAGWARLIDVQDSLQGSSPQLALPAYLACADAAEKSGDGGAAVLCLEAAYRLTFKQAGVQRWDQEAQRVQIARRLQAIKTGQGRKGAAAAYGALAALSEAYEDGGQAEDDKKAYAQAQAQIAAAKAQKEQADNQALMGLFSGTLNSAMGVGMGTLSDQAASLNLLQAEMTYLQADSANSDAAKGLSEAEATLHQSSVRESEDRASRLLAVFLAGATDSAPYAKAVQKEMRRSGLDTGRGALAEFLALAPPDRARSSKREFVQGFQAVEKELWEADLKQAPLALAPLKAEAESADWDRDASVPKTDFYFGYSTQGAYTRVPAWGETSSGKALATDMTATAKVAASVGGVIGWTVRPYQGAGWYFDARDVLEFSELKFVEDPKATGSTFRVAAELGFGGWLPLGRDSNSALSLGLSTALFQFGETSMEQGKTTYDNFDFQALGLDAEASVVVLGFLKVGVAQPLLAPLNGDRSRDAGGTKLKVCLTFAFEPKPSSAALDQAVPIEVPPMAGGDALTVTREGKANAKAAKQAKAKAKAKRAKAPAEASAAAPVQDLAAEKEALRLERLQLEEEKAKLRKAQKEAAGEE